MPFAIPAPDLQISFALLMQQIRDSHLQDALAESVRKLNVRDLDVELANMVAPSSLSTLAGFGLRAELVFATPTVLRANPRLLGYYRLLYGYSQKEFYTGRTGAAAFKAMEERGFLSQANNQQIESLCEAMCSAGDVLISGLGGLRLDSRLLDGMTLLTLGPQLRGGANVKRGTLGIEVVFNVIHKILGESAASKTKNKIELTNAAGKKVLIMFAADPYITIQMEMTNEYRKLIAIEVKAGSDYSNIHNRLGEAEKSHQKARHAGYIECWTVVNVDPFDVERARRASPSTNDFYRISDLVNESTSEYLKFRDHLRSLVGI